jgi:hypothetical protein
MNITSTGLSWKSESETVLPLVSGKLKAGAGVPSGNMVDGVMAMQEMWREAEIFASLIDRRNRCNAKLR